MNRDPRRARRKQWLNRLVSLARCRGDRRPRGVIVSELEDRSDQISRAFNEAHRDRETSETIVQRGHHYRLADLHEGEILTRGLAFIHPALRV
jgi:hypothetical protein